MWTNGVLHAGKFSGFNPFLDPLFVVLHGQIPMAGHFFDGPGSAECAYGVNKIIGIQGGAAFFTLVSISSGLFAGRAGTGDVSVCEKNLVGFVVILFGRFFGEGVIFDQF